VVATLLAAALAAWALTVERMRGMDEGPGTALGGLGWYLGIWVTMMAAMMLPAVAPVVRLYVSTLARDSGRTAFALPAAWLFVGGYLAAWTGYGLLAYGAYRAVTAVESGQLAWDRAGPYVAGGAVAAAGLYQLSPLKRVCLRHCRSPLHVLLQGWRRGPVGAARMGFAHGLYCVGCCWGLMVVLFAVGVMSLFWMAVVAAAIFAEKVLPRGERIGLVLAVALVAFGIWIAVAPGSVPGLVDPSGAGGMTRM
jgi:predicted metal-binding membrane protein